MLPNLETRFGKFHYETCILIPVSQVANIEDKSAVLATLRTILESGQPARSASLSDVLRFVTRVYKSLFF